MHFAVVVDSIIVHGGTRLCGTVQVSGAKNVALKVIFSALLLEGDVILENIPRITDVDSVLYLINGLGGKASFTGENIVTVNGDQVHSNAVDLLYGSKIRASFLLFAPLLWKFGKAEIPNPGGCRLGARPIDRVVKAMEMLGVKVTYCSETGFYVATMREQPRGKCFFEKQTHTGTELLIMLAARSSNPIEIQNAASEPEIDELITFFNRAGAKIFREGTSIFCKGASRLVSHTPFRVQGDRNEAVTYAVAGLVTKGEVCVCGMKSKDLATFITCTKEAGADVEVLSDTSVKFKYTKPLKAVDITTDVHPGFMTDWQPLWTVLMTQAQGTSIIHERMFENRFAYVRELKKLGADIEFIDLAVSDPKVFYHFNYDGKKKYHQAIKVTGPQNLHNAVLQISDLRAGATLIIAALATPGLSVVNGVTHVHRGYERIIEKLRYLGSRIHEPKACS
jgi:UDP-N-acetylglucosamine 1-carboxyvinyltransferase